MQDTLNQISMFADELLKVVTDDEQTVQAKQLYFMDNQEEIRNNMQALNAIITQPIDTTDEDAIVEATARVERATEIMNRLKDTIMQFKTNLVAQNKTPDEDKAPALTEESIANAMQNNATTQEIVKRMDAVAQQSEVGLSYNYALVCDGHTSLLSATTKDILIADINAIVDAGNYNTIQLYKVDYTPIPLKQKVILSI